MPQIKRFRKLIPVVVLGFLYSPVYAHHVSGPTSAVVEVIVPSCVATHAACRQVFSVAQQTLTCSVPDAQRNVTCNLPATVTIPATKIDGHAQFQITRTALLTGKGGEFRALCNATSSTGPCNNLTQYKFQNTTIKRVDNNSPAVAAANTQVQVSMGYTLGLLLDATLNDAALDSDKGFAHTFTSKGKFTHGTNAFGVATNNAHGAQYSFTYVRMDGSCGSATEPFNTAGCTAERRIQCKGPTAVGVVCDTGAVPAGSNPDAITPRAQYTVPPTATSSGANYIAGGLGSSLTLEDSDQKKCGAMFPTVGNPVCRAVERAEAKITYALTRPLDKVDITLSGTGSSGSFRNVRTASTGENLKCLFNESGGSLNPNDKGQFKIRVYGSADLFTNTMNADETFFGISGNPEEPLNPEPSQAYLIKADSIQYNHFFGDPATGVIDEHPDAFIVFDADKLDTLAGITCSAEMAGKENTFVLKSQATVHVSGSFTVSDKPSKNKPFTAGFVVDENVIDTPVSCEVSAVVGPCNPPPQ